MSTSIDPFTIDDPQSFTPQAMHLDLGIARHPDHGAYVSVGCTIDGTQTAGILGEDYALIAASELIRMVAQVRAENAERTAAHTSGQPGFQGPVPEGSVGLATGYLHGSDRSIVAMRILLEGQEHVIPFHQDEDARAFAEELIGRIDNPQRHT